MRAIVNVSEFVSPAVANLCKFWIERLAGRSVIPRGEADIVDRYRLVGIRLANDYGLDFTGLRLTEFEPPRGLAEATSDTYGAVKDCALPAVGHYGYPTRNRKLAMSEFAVFRSQTAAFSTSVSR